MQNTSAWDWTPGKRDIHTLSKASCEYGWLEEFQASPDGEQVATVANVGEGEFTVLVNGEPWADEMYERIWFLRYSPDGRLTGLASNMGEWNMIVSGAVWPETYGYLFGTRFSEKGDVIACGIQQDMRYGMACNGLPWESLFENANQFVLSRCGGHSAAVVQVQSLGQADINTFQQGCYSVAVNGKAWKQAFVNCWTPAFSNDASSVAAQVRTSLYDYTIAVDGEPWKSRYACIWEPRFNPATGAVVAPVRVDGKWGMAQDDRPVWPAEFTQLWHHAFSPDGKKLYAIVAPSFGRWTVAVNGSVWRSAASTMLADLALSPDGGRAAVLAKNGERWGVLCDDTAWSGRYAMAWKPVFSADSSHVAAKVELPGAEKRFTLLVNGKPLEQQFEQLWDPIFSPDSRKLLVRGVQNGVFVRMVIPVDGKSAGTV